MDVGCVIKELEESIVFFRDRVTGDMYDKWLHASVDALALLKAQEPVKPYTERDGRTTFFICGSCNEILCIANDSYKPKHCSECGREVKWK